MESSELEWVHTVRAVNHDSLLLSLLIQGLLGQLDILGIEVGASGATTEDDESVLVSGGSGDGSETMLGDTQEVMLGGRGSNSINGNSQAAIGAVLEADWEREARRKLAVQLGLSGACSDGSEGDQIREELWRDGIKHLAGDWHAGRGQVAEELARDAETLVDLEGLVDVWVVDQTLPADSCAWLLEVGAHDDADVVGELLSKALEALAVLEGSGRVVDGAWAADDEKAVGCAHDDLNGILATLHDGLEGGLGDGDLREEQLRWDQWILAKDWEGELALTFEIIGLWSLTASIIADIIF